MPGHQSFAQLNRIIRVIAMAIGVMTGIGIPLGFGLVGYFAKVSSLDYRTGLAADRLAEYVYVQGKSWRVNENRIADMIAFTRGDGRQSVYDIAGAPVASLGEPISGPTLRVASSIIAHGES